MTSLAGLGSLLVAICVAFDASAIGLGQATLSSGLGEPLRLSFPVSLGPDEDVGCIQVRSRSDDLPSVFNTRALVLRSRTQTRIEIVSPQAVNEPAIGLTVSVGCASPIARDYVLFLDPPAIPAPTVVDSATTPLASVPSPARRGRPAPPRRATAPVARAPRPSASIADPSGDTQGATIPAPPVARAPRAPRGDIAQAAPPSRAESRAARARAARERDRLTVAPTEPPPVGTAVAPGSPVPPSTALPAARPPVSAPPVLPPPATPLPVTPPPVAALPPVPPTPMTPSAPAAPVVDAAPATSAAVGPAIDSGEIALREQELRRQQAELQTQIKALGDQINVLRVQTTTLTTRNQALEASSTSPWLIWFLIALATISVVIAGWMAWRYGQLRRSLEGSPWWSGNAVQSPTEMGPIETGQPVDATNEFSALGGATQAGRNGQRSGNGTASNLRSAASSVGATQPTTTATERLRQGGRNARYPAAIDTDFTVSDIEAAMATVRTVSAARPATRPAPLADASLSDSDFAPLGGASLPAPFTEPQAPPPERPAAPPPPPTPDHPEDDDNATFVDLDLSPVPRADARVEAPPPRGMDRMRTPAALPPKAPTPDEQSFNKTTVPYDFRLDLPPAYDEDDPLLADALKTTVVDRPDPVIPSDFEVPATSTAIDFELPAGPGIAPLSAGADSHNETMPERHGATVLADLFTTTSTAGTPPGPDTILHLDDGEGAPLTTTEVDRLTHTEVDIADEARNASTRFRMRRFADLMQQVDDASEVDPLRAIAQLRQYVLRDEQIPTLLWLRLFELYRKVDKKPVYEALADHFARRYGRPMVGWDENLADRTPQTPLVAMLAIDREVEAKWGTEEGLELLRSLLCDRDREDAVTFNAVLQRDLLDAAKVFPLENNSLTDFGKTEPQAPEPPR